MRTVVGVYPGLKWGRVGDSGFVSYVMDTREKGKETVVNVPIVREYQDVFLDDFPGVPPKRHVEFWIDMVLGVAPIAKAPY